MNAISQSSETANYEMASAMLLAAQPPSMSKPQPVGKDWGRIYAHLESRLQGLRNWRYSWWIYWAELAKFILPRRYHWLVVANRMWRGNPINNAIMDGTATLAMQTCAAGLWSGLTSPIRPWFKLGVALPWLELDQAAEEWLEDTEQRVYTVLSQSNFYNIAAQMYQDVPTFGTSPMIIYEDAEDVIRCYLPCAGEYYLATGSRFSVDVMYREFVLTVAQIVEMFGLENCPADVRELWQTGGGSWQVEMVVAHAIEPNSPLSSHRGGPEVRVVPGSFAYREIYWLRGQNTGGELSRRGFHEKPFVAARWAVVSNDAYGRSPGMDALGDIKQLQLETLRKAEFIEKLVRPPMGADVTMKNEPSSIIPGHITYTSTEGNRKGFWPLFEVRPEALAPLGKDLEEIRGRIKEYFFVNLFMAITQMQGVQPRNELEITKRDLERLQGLGPFINLFETECAGPIVQRVLGILERRRLLKPLPPSLKGIPLKMDYISILKLAQRSAETVSLKDVLITGGQMATAAQAAGLPNPLRIINLDEALRHYSKLSNIDPIILYTQDEVQKNDQAAAKAAQAHQMMAAAPQAVEAAKSLSETNLQGNTALSALLGGGAQAGAP